MYGAGAGERRERRLACHAGGVAAGDDELVGADGADAALGQQFRQQLGGDRVELLVELVDLAVELGNAAAGPLTLVHLAADRREETAQVGAA